MPIIDLAGEVRKLRWQVSRMLPEHDVTCRTKNGLLTFSSKDSRIARRLYSRRQWSWSELLRFGDLLTQHGYLRPTANETFINVGANIGSMLVPMMERFQFARGLGFEPCPKNFRYLRQNVEQNGLADQVDLFPIGLSNCRREAEFELSPKNFGDHRVRESASQACSDRYQEHARTTIAVQLQPLDEVLDQRDLRISPNSLVWVDIQGHEGQFFEGARRALASGVPVISEFWPYGIARSGFNRFRFCQLLQEMFGSFFRWHRGTWIQQPIASITELYNRFEGGRSSTDIVLVRDPL